VTDPNEMCGTVTLAWLQDIKPTQQNEFKALSALAVPLTA
jgi:hypothetical protein